MANSKDPAPDGGAATLADAPVPRRSRRSLFLPLGLFSGLFAAALLASWLYREHAREDAAPVVPAVQPPRPAAKQIERGGNPVECLTRGDQALTHHLYAEALSYYEQLLEGNPADIPLVDYRVGLCNESLGHLENAVASYRKAIGAAAGPGLTIAGHLGVARCLLRQNHAAEARRLLYPFLLDDARQRDVPVDFISDAYYLVAFALAQDALEPPSARPLQDRFLSYPIAALEVPYYLEEIGYSARPAKKTAPAKKSAPPAVRKKGAKQPPLVVQVDQTGPAAVLLEAMIKDAGWRCEWSAGARKTIADRMPHLCVQNWELPNLLEWTADSLDLTCQVTGEAVRFATPAEIEAKQLLALRRAMAQRALNAALRVEATHPWAPAAYLELGNVEAHQGHPGEAAVWFERVGHEARYSPVAVPAFYNLALLQLQKHDFPRARRWFFRTIDQAPAHELALRSHIRIAQTYLEEDNLKDAIVQLRRTHFSTPHSLYEPLAAITLAAAYLQQEQPDKTRLLLANQRPRLQKEPFKSSAAFLDAFAQIRLARPVTEGRREAGELIGALRRDEDETLLGPWGRCLRAEAFAELGFLDQAEQVFRQSAPQVHGPLAHRVEYLLGETLLKQHRQGEAAPLFEKASAGSALYRGRARYQLAQIDLQDRKFKECIAKCSQLWTDQSYPDAGALLHVWGGALEGLGEFAQAAQCFAGKAPNTQSTPQPKSPP